MYIVYIGTIPHATARDDVPADDAAADRSLEAAAVVFKYLWHTDPVVASLADSDDDDDPPLPSLCPVEV